MSRCFPFPPPGYAKKALTHDVDSLKKEKEKEKKRKKEKKEKEKRENKEKREEKDRSDEKHSRDKKDSKENHRDKKDREKDKHGSSHAAGEKKLSGQSEGRNKEKTSDDKKLEKKTEGHSGEEGRNKDRGNISGENRVTGQLSGLNGQRFCQNSHLALDSSNSTFVQGLDRKVRNEDRETSNQLVDKFMGPEKKREGTVKLVSSKSAKSFAKSLGGEKEKNEASDKKLDAKGFGEETRFSASVLVHNHSEANPTRTDGISRPVEKDTHWRMEGKGSNDKLEDKHKDNDREKKNLAEDKDKEKERTKAKDEIEVGEHGSLNEGTKVDLIDTVDVKTFLPPKGSYKTAVPEENLRKRKDLERNGYANDIKTSKLARSTASHPLKDDSRTLLSSQASSAADGHGQAAANSKVDDIMHKENGTAHAQTISFSLTMPSLASATAGQVKEESSKPPHPDSKYLSKVLSVPKLEILSDFDEQEWLFDESGSHFKKPKIGSSKFEETLQVWAEAQRIESADIYALPYVIPY